MNLRRFERKAKTREEPMEKSTANGITKTEHQDSNLVVYLSGKIDAGNFEEIQRRAFDLLEYEPVEGFIFDMSNVSYVSSAGLRMFSAVNHKARELEIPYKLSKMREDIMKLFQMTGYASAFCIELKEE